MKYKVDVEVYEYPNEDDVWVQAKYLARGYSDSLWTDSLSAAITFIRESVIYTNRSGI